MASALRHRDRIEGDLVVEVAFTGVGLDVSDHAPTVVREQALAAVAEEADATPVVMHQVHGAAVSTVGESLQVAREADALVTARPRTALLARAADCVPVLLGDPATGVVAAVHAGRAGMVAGVVPAAVQAMRDLGAEPAVAWVGPHVCGRCYEVPEQLREEVCDVLPQAGSTTSWGTPALDLGAGVRAQLEAAGVPDVRDVDVCTREDSAWPSYRRDAANATRFAGLVWSHP